MRTKPAILAFFALATIATQGLFTSCSSEELPTTEKPSTGTQTLTLNLKPAGTRAAVYTDPGTAAENTINSVTIGIFDKNTGNAVKTIQEVPGSTTPKITTSQLADEDIVLVAVNAKSGTFTGVKNAADFKNRTLGIDDALGGGSDAATTVASSKLPMFGTGTITLKDAATSSYEANVDVYHMVAKVTLNSLSVNFSAAGAYKNATFKPTEVFMSNVPDALDFYPASSYSTFATYTNLCQGQSDVSSNFRSYLGTGTDLSAFSAKNTTLSGVTGAATSNWENTSKILFLYTMPNNATTPTRLVIKGLFAADGTSAVPVYYPVNINYNSANGSAADGGTVKQVYPNMNYIVNVTIQGKGSSDPTVPIDPENATANITVKDFTNASQTNVFN
ncbi:hypothetical protein prwr041_00740 [Prevotella herbatica]|uniref:Major fimbrial subunit protein N-terminal domain-containing protein n=1 Tax=Prevotella herbatica TaxID=2801997 RepID=A0ABM7NUL1_9BACT|nr:hypothetical protein [Prevotella herbatica]BCS84181.1 hypothetical protein prwr041_00740 [Prevotella herbatica]